MESWLKISLFICGFGFIRELRPSEPFVTDFLIQPWRNVTSDEINRLVFPISTYSYASQLIVIFLLTDFLRYKPVIMLSAVAGIIVWTMLVCTTTLRSLQILEIFYGTYMASEIGYYTYAYAKIERKYYLTVTSHARAAVLTGRFCSGAIGQLLIYTKLANYWHLHVITLITQILAFVWSVFVPPVKISQYFHRLSLADGNLIDSYHGNNDNDETHTPTRIMSIELRKKKTVTNIKEALSLIRTHFMASYTNSIVLMWSFWYAMAMCGFLQVISYIQVLWTSIDNTQDIIWNGAVEAVVTLIAAIVALIAGCLHLNKLSERNKLWALLLLSMGEGVAIILTASTNSRTISYFGYLLFYTLYAFTITVASAEIAHHIDDDCFGLIFGFNTLVALIMQTILTLLFVSGIGSMRLYTIFEQFIIYSYYFISVGLCYLLVIVYQTILACI